MKVTLRFRRAMPGNGHVRQLKGHAWQQSRSAIVWFGPPQYTG
jgi:hypothetical protein